MAVRMPVARGVKVTSTTQAAPAANTLSQFLVWAKFDVWGPMMLMERMLNGLLELFSTFTALGRARRATIAEPKFKSGGDT